MHTFENMSYHFWMKTWIKKANNFRIAKVHLQYAAEHLPEFLPTLAYGIAYKGAVQLF